MCGVAWHSVHVEFLAYVLYILFLSVSLLLTKLSAPLSDESLSHISSQYKSKRISGAFLARPRH